MPYQLCPAPVSPAVARFDFQFYKNQAQKVSFMKASKKICKNCEACYHVNQYVCVYTSVRIYDTIALDADMQKLYCTERQHT